jgi:hypothetical protein
MPLSCCLYVKKGVATTAVQSIAGHGSILQCSAYLDAHFPGLPRTMHPQNSVEAAQEIARGPGNVALVGSQTVGRVVDGLDLVAHDIDAGAISNWWAISAVPYFDAEPNQLIVAGRIGPHGTLGRLTHKLHAAGFDLLVAAPFVADRGVAVYDYLLSFSGAGLLSTAAATVSQFEGLRIVGAITDRPGLPTASS